METEEAANPTEPQKGFVANLMDKYGLKINMQMGMIIAVVVIIIAYFSYSYFWKSSDKAEGLEKGSKKAKKKSSANDDGDESTEGEISKLIDDIEDKQSKNLEQPRKK
jgi:H+/gluconate symporter-like permease